VAETEYKIRVTTVVEDQATPALKKVEAAVLDFTKAAEKSGRDVSRAFNDQNKAMSGAAKTTTDAVSSLKRFALQLTGVAIGLGTIGIGIRKGIQEASQYEQAVRKLGTNLELIGIRAKSFRDSLIAQANALERTTRFSDDAILSIQSMLVAFGIAPTKIKPATQAVVDFAAATGKSLEEAAGEIARSMQGVIPRTSELRGILQGMSVEALRAGEGLAKIGQRFSGAALQDVQTFSGAMAQLGNAFRDVLKAVGEFITQSPALMSAIRGMTDLLNNLAEFLAPRGRLAELEAQASQLRTLAAQGPRQTGSFRGEPTFTMGVESQAQAAEKLKQVEAEIARIKRISAESAAKETREEFRQVQAAEQQIRAENRRLRIVEERKKLEPEFEQLRRQILEESSTRIESIDREARERREVIEEAARLNLITELERRQFILDTEDIRLNKIKEVNAKAAEDAQKKKQEQLQAISQNVQFAQTLGGGAKGISLAGGIIGGAVGGGAGAALGVAIGDALKGIGTSIRQNLPTLLTDVMQDAANIFSDVFKGIGGFFKNLGGFLSFRGSKGSLVDAMNDVINEGELAKSILRLTDSLDRMASQFQAPGENITEAVLRRNRATETRREAIGGFIGQFSVREGLLDRDLSDLLAEGRSIESIKKFYAKSGEDVEKAIAELTQAIEDEAQAVVEITNLRIEAAEKETEALIELNNKALIPIRDSISKAAAEIERLKGARTGVSDAFASVISAVSGGLASPEETVAGLKTKFGAAAGEKKAAVGQQLAGALQTQFEAAKNLAAQGAIAGEELASIQADILEQLESTQIESLSEFDRLIATQNAQLDQLKLQEASLLESNDRLSMELQGKIDELKAEAVKQVDLLKEIATAVKKGNLGFLVGQFQEGTPFVPKTGLAMVHEGEAIVPRNRNAGGITININGVAATGSSKEALARAVREVLVQNIGNFRGAVQRSG